MPDAPSPIPNAQDDQHVRDALVVIHRLSDPTKPRESDRALLEGIRRLANVTLSAGIMVA